MKINLLYLSSFILLILLSSCYDDQNELKIAPVFSDHMVLQQNSDVAIWGSGSPGNDIKVICSAIFYHEFSFSMNFLILAYR